MAKNEELERRVGAVERGLAEVRTLAAGAHEDTGTLQAVLRNHTKLINNWGSQINTRMDGLDLRLDGLETRFERLERRIEAGFSTLGAGMAHITDLLEGMNDDDKSAP